MICSNLDGSLSARHSSRSEAKRLKESLTKFPPKCTVNNKVNGRVEAYQEVRQVGHFVEKRRSEVLKYANYESRQITKHKDSHEKDQHVSYVEFVILDSAQTRSISICLLDRLIDLCVEIRQ